MPLLPGKKNVGKNIEELQEHGHPHDQSIAIALKKAGLSRDQNAQALHLRELTVKHGRNIAGMKQVYVRRKMHTCNANKLVLAEVISQDRGMLRVTMQGERGITEVNASDVLPVPLVRPGSITRNPKQPRPLATRSFPRSMTALGNTLYYGR